MALPGFRGAAAQLMSAETLSHGQRVARLYRRSLKTLESWAIKRELFNAEASKIREQFEAGRDASPPLARRLLREAEEKLAEHTHPDPYRICWMPGSSKHMRNPPLPYEVCFPDGVPPEYASVLPVGVDHIQRAPGQEHEGVMVDFATKEFYAAPAGSSASS